MSTKTIDTQSEVNQSVKELTEQLAKMREQVKLAKAKEKMQGKMIDPLRVISTVGEFKGNATIELKPYDGATHFDGNFSFGVKKAQMILAKIDDIRRFVESHRTK